MAHLCGAKTRSGSPCQSKAMPNGRCRMHGGSSKNGGAPQKNKNAVKDGNIYSQFFTDEEKQLSTELELGSLDDELRLTKIRLMRALKAEAEQQDKIDKLELEVRTESPVLFGGVPDEDGEVMTIKQFKRRDYGTIIDRLTARIESLESRRASLVQMSLDAERKRLELDKLKTGEEVGNTKPIRIELVAAQPRE